MRKTEEKKIVLNIPCFHEIGVLRLKVFMAEITVNKKEKWDFSYSGGNLIIAKEKSEGVYRIPFENILRSLYMIEETTPKQKGGLNA